VPHGQRDESLRPYSRLFRPEPLLFLPTRRHKKEKLNLAVRYFICAVCVCVCVYIYIYETKFKDIIWKNEIVWFTLPYLSSKFLNTGLFIVTET
jgi:hypothetical protein